MRYVYQYPVIRNQNYLLGIRICCQCQIRTRVSPGTNLNPYQEDPDSATKSHFFIRFLLRSLLPKIGLLARPLLKFFGPLKPLLRPLQQSLGPLTVFQTLSLLSQALSWTTSRPRLEPYLLSRSLQYLGTHSFAASISRFCNHGVAGFGSRTRCENFEKKNEKASSRVQNSC
jgi:hypothetical protein